MRPAPSLLAAVVAVGSLALLATTTGACKADPPAEPLATENLTPAGPAGPQVQQTEPPAAAAPTAPTTRCEDLGTLAGQALTAKRGSDFESLLLPLVNRPVPSRLGVLAVGAPADLVGPNVPLGAGVNDNYETCTHCLAVALDCANSDCNSATWFYPRSGTAQFTEIDDTFQGSFTDVVLEEVKLDPQTMHSTPVEGGACLTIPQLRFVATVGAPVVYTDGGSLSSQPFDGGASTTSSSGTSGDGTSGASTSGTSGASSSGTTSGHGETSSGGNSINDTPVDVKHLGAAASS
jgi:hypothetical protein